MSSFVNTLTKLDKDFENVRNRKFAPLKSINDNYQKTILTLDRVYNETSNYTYFKNMYNFFDFLYILIENM